MKNLQIIGIVTLLIFIAGCKSNPDKMMNEIKEMEKQLYTNNAALPDTAKTNKLIKIYIEFADEFPKDTNTANFLYKASNLSMNINKDENAITYLDRVIKDFPDYRELPETYFLKAFIYDNNIRNMNKAREAYMAFLQKFPKSDLADDASISLDNLGKTPEQIIIEFQAEERRKADSAALAEQQKKK
jgi:outer membrane protein assembly factor BamD (BamD/ComL family)